jgi:hypothetical protein
VTYTTEETTLTAGEVLAGRAAAGPAPMPYRRTTRTRGPVTIDVIAVDVLLDGRTVELGWWEQGQAFTLSIEGTAPCPPGTLPAPGARAIADAIYERLEVNTEAVNRWSRRTGGTPGGNG